MTDTDVAMSASVPFGLKSLLECMCRALLLAQPEDTMGFLSSYLHSMVDHREDDSQCVTEVIFDYQKQWGKFPNSFRSHMLDT